jgi:hypothetical protein
MSMRRIGLVMGILAAIGAAACGGSSSKSGGSGGSSSDDGSVGAGYGPGNGPTSGTGQGPGTTSTSSGGALSCCVNDSHFSCPNQAALDACASVENPDPSACTPLPTPCGGMTATSTSATGAGPGPTGAGPSTTTAGPSATSTGTGGDDVGKQCQMNSDCLADACLVANGADFGYCTKTCMSFADCPSFWSCENVGNASAMYCVEGN